MKKSKRYKNLDREETLDLVREILFENVPLRAKTIRHLVGICERRIELVKRGVHTEFTYDKDGFIDGLVIKKGARGAGRRRRVTEKRRLV